MQDLWQTENQVFSPFFGRKFLPKGLQVLFSKWNQSELSFQMHLHLYLLQLTFWILQYFVGILFCPFPQPHNSSTLKPTCPEQSIKTQPNKGWWKDNEAHLQTLNVQIFLRYAGTWRHRDVSGREPNSQIRGTNKGSGSLHANVFFQDWDFSSKPIKAGCRQAPKNQGELYRSSKHTTMQINSWGRRRKNPWA